MKQIGKLLDIREGEGKPAALLFAYFFFFGATITVGKNARYTYFFSRFDKTYLPLMFLIAAGAVAFLAFINYFASKRVDLVKNLSGTISLSGLFFACSLILIQSNLNGLVIPFLYVWIDVITIVINFQFVIYAGMVFNSRQARRLFGFILCGSPIAKIIIGAGIPLFVGRFGSGYLLTLTSAFILCCVVMALIARPYISRGQPVRQRQSGTSKNAGFLDGYMKMLALATGAAAVATGIIEYQFLISSDYAFPLEEKFSAFLGIFDSITGFIALFTQIVLTRWILTRFGILPAMRILPTGLGIGAAAMLFNPSLFSALIGRFSEQITKFSLNKTSFDLLWVPVSPDQKQKKKLFIDDTIKTGMQGLTGVFIFLFVKVWPLPYPLLMRVISIAALIALGIWLFTTFHLKSGYVSLLASAIEKRKLDFRQMRLDTTDNEIVKTIEDALNSNEEAKQVFALESISDLSPAPWSNTLRKLFKNGTPSVRAKILAMTAEYPDIISNDDIRNTIEEQGPLAGDALIISGKRKMEEMIPALRHILEETELENAGLCAAAAVAVLTMNRGPLDLAQLTLKKLLQSKDDFLKATALRLIYHIPDFLTDTQLREYCASDSINICSAALDIAHHRDNATLIPSIIDCLKHPQTRSAARKALEIYPPGDVTDILSKALGQDDTDTKLRIEIIRTLEDYPDLRSVSILVQMLKHPSLGIQAVSIDTLLKIARQIPLPIGILKQLEDENMTSARNIYALYQLIRLTGKGADGLLLYDLYTSEIQKRISMLIKLLVLPVPEVPIETYLRDGRYEYCYQAENLIEIIDNILPRKASGYVIPLLQDLSVADLCCTGRRYFTDLPQELDTELARLIGSSNEYHRVVGLDYAVSQRRIKVLEKIDWTNLLDRGNTREILAGYAAGNDDFLINLPRFPYGQFQKTSKELSMLSILEKTIILKDTNLFEGVPGENIYHVAKVMEEQRLEKDTQLFERGDRGDYFYIIVSGEILFHIGERELTRQGKGEYFGEMALLDDSPRSSSATALEETLLLKINQDNFLDIMMDHREVRRSIMKILNERSRRLTDQYTEVVT